MGRESNACGDNTLPVTSPGARSVPAPDASPEVVAPLKRRRRTNAYKLRILAETDACEHRGDLGALLRREGIYHSDLANWRKQESQGLLGGAPASRARRSDPAFQESVRKQAELSRENRDLRRQLGRAKLIIEIQKKAALLLGETLQEMSLDDVTQIDPD
jgi:transposase